MHRMRAALRRRRNRCSRPSPTTTTTTTSTCLVTNDRATGIYLSDAATRLIGGKYGGDVSPREADVQTADVSTSGDYTRNRRTVEGPSVTPEEGSFLAVCLRVNTPSQTLASGAIIDLRADGRFRFFGISRNIDKVKY